QALLADAQERPERVGLRPQVGQLLRRETADDRLRGVVRLRAAVMVGRAGERKKLRERDLNPRRAAHETVLGPGSSPSRKEVVPEGVEPSSPPCKRGIVNRWTTGPSALYGNRTRLPR